MASGIPTFRGPGGYWRKQDPERLATTAAFEADPAMVWEWYRERRAAIQRSLPNPAHDALVLLANHSDQFLLVTQNVDDLHARAEWSGERLAPEQMVQIHGDIFRTRCSRCSFRRRAPEADVGAVPLCPVCRGKLRPGVVWFDEELDSTEVMRIENFLAGGACDITLLIGTTATFDYICGWTLRAKGDAGPLIEVNPEVTQLSSSATQSIRAPAVDALPNLISQLTK